MAVKIHSPGWPPHTLFSIWIVDIVDLILVLYIAQILLAGC